MFYIYGDYGMNPQRLVAHWINLAMATPHASSSLGESIEMKGSKELIEWFFKDLAYVTQRGDSP